MRLQISHRTTFTYDAPIVEAATELRLRPSDGGGQRCTSFRLETEPRGVRVNHYRDHLGNSVGHFDILEPHEELTVIATSEVVTAALDDDTPLSPLERHDYVTSTPLTRLGEQVRDVEPATAGVSAAGRALELMRAVAGTLVYERGATSVQTPAPEVLALGRGVCQDFAHVLIAACRRDGIPARYVSGYLYDDSLAAEHGASHAWVDIWDDGRGWISLDPTHCCEQTDSYARVAVGRDYGDVPPTRGVFKGGAQETLSVSVSVEAA